MKISTYLLLILLYSKTGICGFEPRIKVEGTIRDFNEKIVKLENKGVITSVARQSIPKYFKIWPGEFVFAIVSSSEIKTELKKKYKCRKTKVAGSVCVELKNAN